MYEQTQRSLCPPCCRRQVHRVISHPVIRNAAHVVASADRHGAGAVEVHPGFAELTLFRGADLAKVTALAASTSVSTTPSGMPPTLMPVTVPDPLMTIGMAYTMT
jgi:hypothetical protein